MYAQPEENLRAEWLRNGGARFILIYRGREWHREVRPNDYVTVVEAAALSGFSRQTAYQWIERNLLHWTSRAFEGDDQQVTVFKLADLRRFLVTTRRMR